MTSNSEIAEKVAEIYDWLDLQIRNNNSLSGKCLACGNCCDFQKFDHQLFITTPELIYLAAKLGSENIKPMTTSRCPYNLNGKCAIYKHRFAGCRIFYCKAAPDSQSRLSELVLKKLKSLCEEFSVPYRYSSLAAALNNSAV